MALDTVGVKEASMSRHLCQRCHDRKARFRYRGVVRADSGHTLCFECYRSERNRTAAHRLADMAPLVSPLTNNEGGARTLSERQVAHRQRMLAHMSGETNIAS